MIGGLEGNASGTTHGSKQHGQRALHVGQQNPRGGKLAAGLTRDEAMPDSSNPFFQFEAQAFTFLACHIKMENGPATMRRAVPWM